MSTKLRSSMRTSGTRQPFGGPPEHGSREMCAEATSAKSEFMANMSHEISSR